jgi:hypothetical protein
MRSKFLIAVLTTITIAGCKKDNSSGITRIEVNVQSFTSTNLSGLNIQLFSDEKRTNGDNIAQSQSNGVGKIDFDVTAGKTYYLYHYNSDGKVLADINAVYIVTGQFTSQLQINSSPTQTPAAKIGDDIHQDINGDGIIDKYDMVIKVIAPNAGTTKRVNFVVN